jgi:hypothetical protein
MKYLFTFAVATRSLKNGQSAGPEVENGQVSQGSASQEEVWPYYERDVSKGVILEVSGRETKNIPAVVRVENKLCKALVDKPDLVGYYRVIMDSWNATHVALADWIIRQRPRSSR